MSEFARCVLDLDRILQERAAARRAATSPCCESYAPVASPDASVSAAKAPSTVLLSLVQAPAVQKAPKSTTRVGQAGRQETSATRRTSPPSGRAPPVL